MRWKPKAEWGEVGVCVCLCVFVRKIRTAPLCELKDKIPKKRRTQKQDAGEGSGARSTDEGRHFFPPDDGAPTSFSSSSPNTAPTCPVF